MVRASALIPITLLTIGVLSIAAFSKKPSIVVAAANAPDGWKDVAGLVLRGIDDQEALASIDWPVIFSPGTFRFSTPLSLWDDTQISGQGDSTLIEVESDIDAFVANGVSRINLSGLVLRGRSPGNVLPFSAGVRLDGVVKAQLSGITSLGFNEGISVGGGSSGVVVNGNSDIYGNTGIGIALRDSFNIRITGSSIHNNGVDPTKVLGDGITCISSQGVVITGNSIHNNLADGVDIEPGRDVVIVGNDMNGNGSSHVLVKLPDTENVVVANNTMRGGGGVFEGTQGLNAIEVSIGARLVRVIGNTIFEPGLLGVSVDSAGAGIEVASNAIYRPQHLTFGQGINVAATLGADIHDNYIDGAPLEAIRVHGAADRTRVVNNRCVNPLTSGLTAIQIGIAGGIPPVGPAFVEVHGNQIIGGTSLWAVAIAIGDPNVVGTMVGRNVTDALIPLDDRGTGTVIL